MFGFVGDFIDNATSTAVNTAKDIGGGYIDLYGSLAPTVASFVGVDPEWVKKSYSIIGNSYNSITGGNYVSDDITGLFKNNKLPQSYEVMYSDPNQNVNPSIQNTTPQNSNNFKTIGIIGSTAMIAYFLFDNKKTLKW